MKKIVFVLLLSVALLFAYSQKTNVTAENHEHEIKHQIEKHLDRDKGILSGHQLRILKKVRLADTNHYTVLFEFVKDGETAFIGHAEFNKTSNGKFQLAGGMGYGVNLISHETIFVEGNYYKVVYGKNNEMKINKITADILDENYKFTVNVAGEKFFVKYHKLPGNVNYEKTYPTLLKYFDKNENLIPWDEVDR